MKIFKCVYCSQEHPFEFNKCPTTGRELSRVHKLQSVILNGKYLVKGIIGEGGMGVIYESQHMEIGKRFAIKFLNPEVCKSRETYERFQREAKAAAAINHKNIVSVIDTGKIEDDIPYIIMEYLAGEDLNRRIATEGRLSCKEAGDILSQMLEALSAVHSCGIVHRDLKPENVFLSRQSGGSEIVKILDFGISRLSMEENKNLRLTKAGYVYGTPSYISPEQAAGNENIDHRADLYSAGTIFYEMITGNLPFKADTYTKLLVEIITKPHEDPRRYLPELPQSIVDFLNLALAKNPAERFRSAQEMLRELKSIDLNFELPYFKPPHYPGQRKTTTPDRKRTTPVAKTPPKKRKRRSSYQIVTTQIRKTPSRDTRKEAPPPGSYRIVTPMRESVIPENGKTDNQKETDSDTKKVPSPPVNNSSKIEFKSAARIERATTLPTGESKLKASMGKSCETTPNPDMGEDES